MGNKAYTKPKEVASQHLPALIPKLPSQEGKVVAITGCTTGTGLAFAQVAAEKGATVLMLNRPSSRADAALQTVQAKGKAIHVDCDLMSFEEVRKTVAKVLELPACSDGLDVLCCNAGIMASKDEATVDGCDTQMQTNHLSHFILAQGLAPLLEKAAARGEARIVSHSSIARTGKKIQAANLGKNGGNLGGDKSGMMPFSGPRWDRYQQTKLANYVFTMALHDRLAAKGSQIKALCAHPGVAATELQVKSAADGGLSSNMSSMSVRQSGEDGACGILTCSFGDVKSGEFYGPSGVGMSGAAVLLPVDALADAASKQLLWTESEKTTGISFAL